MDPDLDPTDNMPSRAALAREALLYRMKRLSKLFYESEWVEDLEIEIWNMAHTKPYAFADKSVADSMAKYFRDLIQLAGGFWVWPVVAGKEGDDVIFITLEEWEKIRPKLNA